LGGGGGGDSYCSYMVVNITHCKGKLAFLTDICCINNLSPMYYQIKYFRDENMHKARKHAQAQDEHREQHVVQSTSVIMSMHQRNQGPNRPSTKGIKLETSYQRLNSQRRWPHGPSIEYPPFRYTRFRVSHALIHLYLRVDMLNVC
jgi:hypothetical protein